MAVATAQPSVRDEVLGGDAYRMFQVGPLMPPARGGKEMGPEGVWRLIKRGKITSGGRVVKLEGVRIGRDWYTSAAAVRRFLLALSEVSEEATAQPAPSQVERVNAQVEANAVLDRAGI